jgi:hypothetical protein
MARNDAAIVVALGAAGVAAFALLRPQPQPSEGGGLTVAVPAGVGDDAPRQIIQENPARSPSAAGAAGAAAQAERRPQWSALWKRDVAPAIAFAPGDVLSVPGGRSVAFAGYDGATRSAWWEPFPGQGTHRVPWDRLPSDYDWSHGDPRESALSTTTIQKAAAAQLGLQTNVLNTVGSWIGVGNVGDGINSVAARILGVFRR